MRLTGLLFLLFSLAFFRPAQAQDRLLLSDGNEIKVIVLEVRPDSVFFSSLTDSVTNSVSKKVSGLARSSVFSITYQNGRRELMVEPVPETLVSEAPVSEGAVSEADFYRWGRADAIRNHKATGVYFGTLGATVLLGVPWGLVGGGIVGGAVGFSDVQQKNFKPSQRSYLQSASYKRGYLQEANKKKRNNAIAGYATGVGVWVSLAALIFFTFGF